MDWNPRTPRSDGASRGCFVLDFLLRQPRRFFFSWIFFLLTFWMVHVKGVLPFSPPLFDFNFKREADAALTELPGGDF